MKGEDKERIKNKITVIYTEIESILYNAYFLEAIFRLNDMTMWGDRMERFGYKLLEFKDAFDELVEKMKEEGII